MAALHRHMKAQARVEEADRAIDYSSAAECVASREVWRRERRDVEASALGNAKVQQIMGGRGQGSVAVVDVPSRGRVERALDVVHELQHGVPQPFILFGTLLEYPELNRNELLVIFRTT
jgi:hypothetical protein